MGTTMNSAADRAETQAQLTAEKRRAFILPALAAIFIFSVIAYLQFTPALGQYNFIAQFPLGIGFYLCYAWHNSLAQKANVHAEKLKKG
jgi:hypothetical protein